MTAQAARADSSSIALSYDEVPYQSFTYGRTHPRHLAMVGTLFGMSPPDLKTARVLELGCASGGNLFSQALAYPDAQFTGIDLSGEQIALADQMKAKLGVKNINFLQQDIMQFDLKANAGKFDYIIAHGVMSWVPDAVQAQILELCQHCLSENGLAIISYNTLPGWNAVRSLREMMQFHVKRFDSAREKIDQSRALLTFLAENVSASQNGYREVIEAELNTLRQANDSYLFHDHLEADNTQFYFHEFVAAIRSHKLDYVGDTAFASMFIGNMTGNAASALQAMSDIVLQEQYMDFVKNRRFRSSIICKAGRAINRNLTAQAIMKFYLTGIITPKQDKPDANGQMTFVLPSGSTFDTNNAISSALYLELAKSGKKPVYAKELIARAVANHKVDAAMAEQILLESGMDLALRGFIELHIDSPEFMQSISDKPEIYSLARAQAGMPGCPSVTCAVHDNVNVDPLSCLIIQQLDGTRTTDEAIDAATSVVLDNNMSLMHNGQALTTRADIRARLAEIGQAVLTKSVKEALLVG